MSAIESELRAMITSIVREELDKRKAANDADVYLSAQEAAAFASVADGTIRRWIREGKLEGHRAGRVLRVKRSALEALLRDGAPRDLESTDVAVRRLLDRHIG